MKFLIFQKTAKYYSQLNNKMYETTTHNEHLHLHGHHELVECSTGINFDP